MPISFGGKYYEDMLEVQLEKVGFFDSIFGKKEEPKEVLDKAPSLTQYATDEDVNVAKQYGFYDQMYEPFSKGDTARILGEMKTTVTGKGKGKQLRSAFKPLTAMGGASLDQVFESPETTSAFVESNPKIADTLAKGFMVSNRIPLAALGFDPSKVMIDSYDFEEGEKATIGGAYDADKDMIYINQSSKSTVVHEAIHRGIEMLRKKNPEFFETNPLPREESIVRYLMATQAGDPEKGIGEIADKQRNQGKWEFEQNSWKDKYQASLTKLTKMAEEELGTRTRRRGPD